MQNRGGLGIKVAKLDETRGDLVGALLVEESDEVLVVLAGGKVVRSAVSEVPAKGRDTMGVVFARFADEDKIIAVAKNSERNLEASTAAEEIPEAAAQADDVETDVAPADSGESDSTDPAEAARPNEQHWGRWRGRRRG